MRKTPQHNKEGVVRIIGGRWRGRKLHFPALDGLRPTADRTRETLFNWLMSLIQDAVCLDLFAGSGALGFEALSRGAKQVVMVDQSKEIIAYLKEQGARLQTQDLSCFCLQIPQHVLAETKQFDLVFLDPPFHLGLIKTSIDWLLNNHYLAPQALIYIETEQELSPLPIPSDWTILKRGHAGQVNFYLVQTT